MSTIMGRTRPWTSDELKRLDALGDSGTPWDIVGLDLGRSAQACKQRYNDQKRREHAVKAAPLPNGNRYTARKATDAGLALAREQLAAQPNHRSITSEFFGDPLPGRSALDRRQPERSSISLAGDAR